MNTLNLAAAGWFALVALAGLKMLIDQDRFLRAYRKQVNPRYPILPGEKASDFGGKGLVDGPLGLGSSSKVMRLMFAKAPSSDLERLRRRAWNDLLLGVAAMVGGFLLIALLITLRVQ